MLSERQIELLKAIIDAYITTSEPVGSVELVNRYRLNVSAATVRNEMAKLLEEGFLSMVHTSSGRIPTPMAYRYYLNELIEEAEMPVLQEVAMKQRLWPSRFDFDRLLREAAIALADITKELAIITSTDGYVTHAGAVNVLDHKEFWDINVAKAALHLLDRHELLEEIFQRSPYGGEVRYAIGDELGNDNLAECGIIFAPYETQKRSGYVALLGPARIRYEKIIPAIKYTKNLIENLGA